MSTTLAKYLAALVEQKGSDLHIAADSVPMLRIRGELSKIDQPPLKADEVEKIFAEVLNDQQRRELSAQKTLDFAIKVNKVGIFRANLFYQRHGLAGVFRALTERPPTIEELNLPPICRLACHYPQGLVLVTGPTGSGKSTTLAAMINHINETERGHVLTLEDPIEFQHDTKRCMVNQRQLGTHFTSFSSALKAALREDPDVILVGEMRDPETIALAITAAETGHLVFATLHTNSAAKTIDRILDSFPGDQQSQIRSMLSESLRAVISQKLIPRADGKGRICIQDILVANSAVANLIREGKTYQIPSVMQTGKKEGMQVMDQVLLEAVREGKVRGEDAWEHANDKTAFAQWAHTTVSGHTKAAQPAKESQRVLVPGLPKTAAPGTPAAPGVPPGFVPPHIKKTG